MRTSEGYRRLVTAYERDAAERAERAAERTDMEGTDVEGTDAEGAGEDVTEGVA
jgi:hypothetical protein